MDHSTSKLFWIIWILNELAVQIPTVLVRPIPASQKLDFKSWFLNEHFSYDLSDHSKTGQFVRLSDIKFLVFLDLFKKRAWIANIQQPDTLVDSPIPTPDQSSI